MCVKSKWSRQGDPILPVGFPREKGVREVYQLILFPRFFPSSQQEHKSGISAIRL